MSTPQHQPTLPSQVSPPEFALSATPSHAILGVEVVALPVLPGEAGGATDGATDGATQGLLLGPGAGITTSLQGLSVGLLAAFTLFYVLGFALYSLIYAAAGSLVSRPEDLQIIALPLSLIAIQSEAAARSARSNPDAVPAFLSRISALNSLISANIAHLFICVCISRSRLRKRVKAAPGMRLRIETPPETR